LKRLLYVAMTRAKDLLVLPTHDGLKPAACWQQWLAPAIEKFSKEGRLSVVDASRGRKSDSKGKTLQRKRTPPHVMIERTLQTSVTVSELECYYRCPQEYFLKYEMRLPARQLAKKDEERLPANVVGSIVHTTIEKLAKTPRPDLTSAIAAACVANGVMPDAEACARISGIVAPFIQLPIARKLGEGMKEMRFDWKFGDRTITGVIDWLLPAGDALEIFDFKTDRIEPGEEAERAQSYDLQLACYGLAAEAALQRTVCSTSLIFLMTRTLHSEKMDGARREKSRKLISDIIGSIDRKDFDIKGPWPNCVRCAYKHNGLCKIAK
jgi:ATP-dependent exoDNAse (exonuclease V) beta subunit